MKDGLMSLDISNNAIGAEGARALAGAFKNNQTTTDLNMSTNSAIALTGAIDLTGLHALADTVQTMGALTCLNISNNKLVRPDDDVSG